MHPPWCHGSQDNGIVWFGKVIGRADDQYGSYLVIRYYIPMDAEPPRRAIRVARSDSVRAGLPSWLDRGILRAVIDE